MPAKKRPNRGAAAESVGFRINEGPPRAPRKPFRITYLGDGVATVDGIGLFTRGTSAEATRSQAERYRGLPDWEVQDNPDV